MIALLLAACAPPDAVDTAAWTAPDHTPDAPGALELPTAAGGDVTTPPGSPRVLGVSPAPDAVGVVPDATISVRFSAPMDPDATTALLAPWAADVDVAWSAADRLELTPSAPLGSLTAYTVTVPFGRAKAGAALEAEVAWTFTTADVEPPVVLAVTPTGTWADPTAPVDVTFDEPVDPRSLAVSLSPAVPGNWTLAGDHARFVAYGLLARGAAYTVSVQATDLAGNAMPAPVASTFHTALRERVPTSARSGSGAWRFVDVAEASGARWEHGLDEWIPGYNDSGGVAAGDFDRDGYVDLWAVRAGEGPPVLLHNLGDGTFEEVAAAHGAVLPVGVDSAPAMVDFTGDGWLDLAVTDVVTGTHLLASDGDGGFVDVTDTAIDQPFKSYGMAFADVDGDHDLDLFLSHGWGIGVAWDAADPRFFFLNDGTGRFTDHTAAAGFYGIDLKGTYTPNFADIDLDGDPDLLSAGDFGWTQTYRNDGGRFTRTTTAAITDENGMGGAVGDYDNDGDLDWFVGSIWDYHPGPLWNGTGNRLYRNRGDGSFQDVSAAAGVRNAWWSWGVCFADVDLDGDLDLYVVDGHVYYAHPNQTSFFWDDPSVLFLNQGDGTFVESAASLGLADREIGRGLACTDVDRDGDVDLVVSRWEGPSALYRNDLPTGHFLNVALRGEAPNTEVIGARVYATTGAVTQLREIHAGNNFASQDPAEAHFGLGDATTADVRVVWPGGAQTSYPGVPADRFLEIDAP